MSTRKKTKRETTRKPSVKKADKKHSKSTSKIVCDEVTIKEIKAHPKYKSIEGRSAMNKAELCKALNKAKKSSVVKVKKEKREPREKKEPSPKKEKKTAKPLPKRPVKKSPAKVYSPIRSTDLTAAEISDLFRISPKSKYMRPISEAEKQKIRLFSQRKLEGVSKTKQRVASPLKKSPSKVAERGIYVPIHIAYNGKEYIYYGVPGEIWATVIRDLPDEWDAGTLYDTTFIEESEIKPFDIIPSIPVQARFKQTRKGWFF